MRSAVFGAAWAFLPGYLQAKRGSHVVVTTIMFNFIAAGLMNFIIVKYMIPEGDQNPASRTFTDAAAIPLPVELAAVLRREHAAEPRPSCWPWSRW